MASLHYEILTDPAPLQVPGAGEESQGAVHVVVSNPTMDEVIWYSIEIRVPAGPADGDLTLHPKTINARVEHDTATKQGEEPAVVWDGDTGVLTVTARPNTLFRQAGSLALVLDGFPVSAVPGLVLLHVTERAANGARVQSNPVTLSLLKQVSRVPRNFRPKDSLVASGKDVVLRWDGPDTLTYRIQGPDGSAETVTSRNGASGWEWSPKAGQEPKRDATYTLMATSPGSQQPGSFLTTTVHLRSPEFEGVTATNGVRAPWVGDRDAGKGWIEFPQSGVNVRRDGKQEWGTVAADKADLNGINTKWVQGRTAADGWIEFPTAGLNVFQGAGNRQWGTVAADKADLNDVTTQRATVGERLTLQGGLTVDNVLETQDGPPRLIVRGRLDAEGEVNANGALVVRGESQFEGKVNANGHLSVRGGGAWVMHTNDGKISVNGELRVQGDSLFIGKVNANGHLSVRNKDVGWIMHTRDDLVAINGDLRVHGAFRSDS
ncbi:hypothetical protein ACFQ7O_32550 [Streptomyces sp. NPDC056485]|uniref:hypothetical protein n=1 Tax=Streptomyces sp. NPDC056485 TaxID=3345834 RepID=UPI0036A05717